MKIAIGSDHRGFQVRQRVLSYLKDHNFDSEDMGCNNEEGVDYPDIAQKVADEVVAGRADRGVLICGTGIGMSIAANKIDGIRAAHVHDDVTAELSRSHNDSNVICLSADMLGERLINHILDIWLNTKFEGGRHQRRIDKIHDIEKGRP